MLRIQLIISKIKMPSITCIKYICIKNIERHYLRLEEIVLIIYAEYNN